MVKIQHSHVKPVPRWSRDSCRQLSLSSETRRENFSSSGYSMCPLFVLSDLNFPSLAVFSSWQCL